MCAISLFTFIPCGSCIERFSYFKYYSLQWIKYKFLNHTMFGFYVELNGKYNNKILHEDYPRWIEAPKKICLQILYWNCFSNFTFFRVFFIGQNVWTATLKWQFWAIKSQLYTIWTYCPINSRCLKVSTYLFQFRFSEQIYFFSWIFCFFFHSILAFKLRYTRMAKRW